VTQALVVVVAYLLGSIPFAYLAGRTRGIDIRTVGSKNVGASNVFRELGKGMGVTVMALDIAKGLLAVVIANSETSSPWPLIAAAAAIVGHVFPVWLRFRGGKGVAVAGGAMIGLVPFAAVMVLILWVIVVGLTRYVSVGSIVAAAVFPFLVLGVGAPWPTIVFAFVVAIMVIVRHRANVHRLRGGQELRLDFRRARTRSHGRGLDNSRDR
jgi:acyl phosphate:glycerol-3-phosphate acyltransferase